MQKSPERGGERAERRPSIASGRGALGSDLGVGMRGFWESHTGVEGRDRRAAHMGERDCAALRGLLRQLSFRRVAGAPETRERRTLEGPIFHQRPLRRRRGRRRAREEEATATRTLRNSCISAATASRAI